MKSSVLHKLKEYLLIILGGVFYAFAVYYFIYENKFTSGGVAGVVAMICYFLPERFVKYGGVINLCIHVPLLIFAFFKLDKDFAIKTMANVLAVSVTLYILPEIKDVIGMDQYIVNGDVGKSILAALFGGAIAGITLSFVLKVNACTGGPDIIAAYITKKNPAYSIQWMIFITNAVIIGASVIVFSFDRQTGAFSLTAESIQPIMLALIFQFMNSKMSDIMMKGSKVALKFEVVTDHPEELSNDLLTSLKHGVTVIPAKGMYARQDRALLICVVKKGQIEQFKEILKKYPDTFAYVCQVNEIFGSFNR